MRNPALSTDPWILAAGILALLLVVPGPAAAAGPAGSSALGGSTSMSDPCPKTVQIDGRTAYLGGYVCGSVTLGVGGNLGPVSIGFSVGHCTGCECSYVWDMSVGMQFTRTAAAECGWGSAGGSDGQGKLDPVGDDSGGCVWGRDYIGWEPRGC